VNNRGNAITLFRVLQERGVSSVWVSIRSQSALTYGSSPPQIGTLEAAPAGNKKKKTFRVVDLFSVSTSVRLDPLCGKEERTFRYWSHTSSIISRENG